MEKEIENLTFHSAERKISLKENKSDALNIPKP